MSGAACHMIRRIHVRSYAPVLPLTPLHLPPLLVCASFPRPPVCVCLCVCVCVCVCVLK
jgi:hypothetical protein